MDIKNLINNPTFKKYFYYVTLVLAIYSLATDSIFLSKLIIWNERCPTFGINKALINEVIQKETNIALWDTSATDDTEPISPDYFPETNATIHVLRDLIIKRGDYFATFHMFEKYGVNKGLKSYAGVVGTANETFSLVTLVAAADNHTTSYFFIREGNPILGPFCQDILPNCLVRKQISFPFTAIKTGFDRDNSKFVMTYSDNSTFSINPGLQLYVCQYAENITNSYNWAKKFATAVGIILLTLETFKAAISFISTIFQLGDRLPSVVNFSNNSPVWFFLLTKDNMNAKANIEIAMNLEETNSLQLLCDTFLHSLPMLVLTIQSLTYRLNETRVPPPTISILSCVGSCVALFVAFFRIYVAVKVVIPKQAQEFKDEMSQHFVIHSQQRQQNLKHLVFALIDSTINILPLIFMISLAVQEFNSIFIFIIPLLIAFAKILICISLFWTSRFRKPLPYPKMFAFALNSPVLLLCVISSPVRQLTTIIAASGVTSWIGWPMDFISIDLPILVTLIMMKVFGHGNERDVILLQQNNALVILVTFYLIWRIISGIWYLRNNIITRKENPRSTATFPFFYALKLQRGSPTLGIFFYSLCKLLIWVTGLRTIISMVFTSQPPPPKPAAFVTVSPKILMVLGLVIYLCLDFMGSLALLISFYGPFSTKTIALYINSSFILFFYTFLGSNFRNQFIAAAKDHLDALLLWKQRDMVLICSFLFVWPGFGFGYKSYGYDDNYSWWSWYGWGYDHVTQEIRNVVESHWSFSGLLGSIFAFSYCIFSIFGNYGDESLNHINRNH
jgi:hypothetical protein